ncbi:MAG: hypothetical protein HN383_18150 [Verrucomicrobia bacterium]|nr:hypothetical protein [Verrucomicrobiota bacterium]
MGICEAAEQPSLIPESEIMALQKELASPGGSAVAARRTMKNIVRKTSALLQEAPEAPNRFAVLGIMFQAQKTLLAQANTERNGEALFLTCEALAEAPDEYAEIRLEADLLLSERELSDKDATLAERAEALAEVVERYKGTPAEARSLLMGALIVRKLDAPEFENSILYVLNEKYADDHEVIEFRRRFLKVSRLDLVFSGMHSRVDGTTLVFPADTMGHMSLMVFWSKNEPGIETYLAMQKEELAKYPGLIDVFSFNVDELPDGGESVLKEHGLDWTIMALPGGRRSQAYRTYAQVDPCSLLVNEYGVTVIRPEVAHGPHAPLDGSRVSDGRYMAHLQSLFIGECLVGEGDGDEHRTSNIEHRTSKLETIQACFVPPPFRYRLTREEALANYTKAARLCAEAIRDKPKADDISALRDRRIIALLGMWNTACEPRYLEEAVKESKAALAAKPALGAPGTMPKALVPGADVVPRFCLAKAALRENRGRAEQVVRTFVEQCGGKEAPAAAMVAAAILSIEGRSRELLDGYRATLLDQVAEDPRFYSFTSFLRDRHHQYRLLNANYAHRVRGARWYIMGHDYSWPTNYLPVIELKKLDGSELTLPKDTNGKLTLLTFVEPPADGISDYEPRGGHMMGYAESVSTKHVNKDINYVTAFLTDNADHVSFLMKTNGWSCQPVLVPGGLANPMVRQLGVYSADRLPNVFLLRRDGSIAWRASGLWYKNEYGFPWANCLGMKFQVEVCEVEHAYRALEDGDYKEAARVFAGPYLPWDPDRFGWRPPRYHGRALAFMGLKEWEAALESIDTAIDAQKLHHFRGKRRKWANQWRKDAVTVIVEKPDDVLVELWATKAVILDKLGRKEDAASVRKRSEEPVQPGSENIYWLFHQRLKNWRMNKQKAGESW